MIVLDVNVLVNTSRQDLPHHARVGAWLNSAATGGDIVGVSDVVLSGYVRLATNRRVFAQPTSVDAALEFCDALLRGPAIRRVAAGTGHWGIWRGLVADQGLRANHIPDAYLAALALEYRAVLATSDRGFSRYPGLRTLDPSAG